MTVRSIELSAGSDQNFLEVCNLPENSNFVCEENIVKKDMAVVRFWTNFQCFLATIKQNLGSERKDGKLNIIDFSTTDLGHHPADVI